MDPEVFVTKLLDGDPKLFYDGQDRRARGSTRGGQRLRYELKKRQAGLGIDYYKGARRVHVDSKNKSRESRGDEQTKRSRKVDKPDEQGHKDGKSTKTLN